MCKKDYAHSKDEINEFKAAERKESRIRKAINNRIINMIDFFQWLKNNSIKW